ncbi:MAG: O-methyltransferase [Oscillospiraceae bacterium]|nr:O-methyltransferase [Oscillospiraceae bacterium]
MKLHQKILGLERRLLNSMILEVIKTKALADKIPIIKDDALAEIIKILQEIKPKNMLEIGSAVGYSAICFAPYVLNKIDTIEIDEKRAKTAISNIKKAGLTNKINLIMGDALEVLPNLKEKYDVVFIDASKSKYPMFLEHALAITTENATIIADNVLYFGYVLGDYNKHKQRSAVTNLRKFLNMVNSNPKLKINILEVGDGLAVISKEDTK